MTRKKSETPPTTPSTPTPAGLLASVARTFQSIQRDRIGLERALETRNVPADHEARWVHSQLVEIEKRTVKYLESECAASSVWPWLSQIKGIGPRLGGMLIGLIDIRRANTVSALWRYAGQAVVFPCQHCEFVTSRVDTLREHHEIKHKKESFEVSSGKAERPVKGEKLHYNALLKKTMYLIARQFIMAGTEPYNGFYREAKERYTREREGWRPGRIELAARRKMVKMFLSHLWLKWREAEGLPVGMPYVHAIKGHTNYTPPPEPSRGA